MPLSLTITADVHLGGIDLTIDDGTIKSQFFNIPPDQIFIRVQEHINSPLMRVANKLQRQYKGLKENPYQRDKQTQSEER